MPRRGGEEEGRGGPVPGTSRSLYNRPPGISASHPPPAQSGPHKDLQRGRVLLVDHFGGLREGPHMFQSRGLLSRPDTDWYKSMPCAWKSAALHTPPQLSWSERGFNCLIIILHYPCGPIAWFGVAFSASPHPLLPKRRHPRNSSRWWWRVNWEGLSCCPGYRHWYFCCPNKHHSQNQPWGDTKPWGNKQTEECFDCDVNKINKVFNELHC